MSDVSKMAAKGLFYFVALVLLVWTSSLTVSFVSNVLPDVFWVVPFLALVMFDVGQVAWLFVFLNYARGAGQRAVSIGACLLDFVGVGLMVTAEILLGGQSLVAAPQNLATYAVWGLGLWTVANVGAVILFHLLQPEARKKMAMQSEMDAVFEESLQRLTNMRAAHSGRLSQQMANGMMQQLVAQLAADADRDGIPDVWQDALPQIAGPGSNAEPPALPGKVDRLKSLPDRLQAEEMTRPQREALLDEIDGLLEKDPLSANPASGGANGRE